MMVSIRVRTCITSIVKLHNKRRGMSLLKVLGTARGPRTGNEGPADPCIESTPRDFIKRRNMTAPGRICLGTLWNPGSTPT